MDEIDFTPRSSKDLKNKTRLGAGFLIAATMGSGIAAVVMEQPSILAVSALFAYAALRQTNIGGRQIKTVQKEEARECHLLSLSSSNKIP